MKYLLTLTGMLFVNLVFAQEAEKLSIKEFKSRIIGNWVLDKRVASINGKPKALPKSEALLYIIDGGTNRSISYILNPDQGNIISGTVNIISPTLAIQTVVNSKVTRLITLSETDLVFETMEESGGLVMHYWSVMPDEKRYDDKELDKFKTDLIGNWELVSKTDISSGSIEQIAKGERDLLIVTEPDTKARHTVRYILKPNKGNITTGEYMFEGQSAAIQNLVRMKNVSDVALSESELSFLTLDNKTNSKVRYTWKKMN